MDDFEKWKQELQNLSFEEFAVQMKDKILTDNSDELSKQYFQDCFDYVFKLYKTGKPLEVNLLKIYLEQVKNYKNLKMIEFIRTIILLSFCGFNFKFDKN